MVNDKELIIPPLNEVEDGYTGFTLSVFPSVCLFIRLWTECCPLCIFHNTIRIHFIFRHLINQLQRVCHLLSFVKNSKIWIFRNFFKFAPLTLPCVYPISMLRVDSSTYFYCCNFSKFSKIISLDSLLAMSSGFHQNCNFVFLANFFNCTFLPFSPRDWRGIVITVRAGWGTGGRAGGCQTRKTHLCKHLTDLLHSKFSVELSRPVVVHCHGHLPICPIWACPWAKNLSNLPQIGSRLCGTHISEIAGWIYSI